MPNDGYREIADLGSSSHSDCSIRARLQARPSQSVFYQCSAASTSSPLRPAVPHYFFSQIDDKLSRLPGRLAVSVHRKTPPLRTQQGMHIVLKEFSTALAASRHRSKRVLLSKRLKQR